MAWHHQTSSITLHRSSLVNPKIFCYHVAVFYPVLWYPARGGLIISTNLSNSCPHSPYVSLTQPISTSLQFIEILLDLAFTHVLHPIMIIWTATSSSYAPEAKTPFEFICCGVLYMSSRSIERLCASSATTGAGITPAAGYPSS